MADDPFAESSDDEAAPPPRAPPAPRPGARGRKRRRRRGDGGDEDDGEDRQQQGGADEQAGRDRVRSRLESLRAADENRRREEASRVRAGNAEGSRNVVVRNLRPETRVQDVAQRFAAHGSVEAVRIDFSNSIRALETTAVVLFASVEEAERAFRAEHRASFQGRKLELAWASMPRDLARAKASFQERLREEILADDDIAEADAKSGAEAQTKTQTGAALERAKDDAFCALLLREREALVRLLEELDDKRRSVARVMLFCIAHADAARECYDLVTHELVQGPLAGLSPVRAHRLLYVLSDLLFNSNASVAKAARYRTLIEVDLALILARMGMLMRDGDKGEGSFSSRLFEGRVLAVLEGWERRITFSAQFLAGLRFSFLNDVLSVPAPATEDGAPSEELRTLDEVKATCLRFGLPFTSVDDLQSGLARLRFAQQKISGASQEWDAPSYPSSMDGEPLTTADLAALADDDGQHRIPSGEKAS